jgi:hypothetical protein
MPNVEGRLEVGWGAKGPETLDFYTVQENVFIALKHGVFLMTVIRKLSLMTDLGLTIISLVVVF